MVNKNKCDFIGCKSKRVNQSKIVEGKKFHYCYKHFEIIKKRLTDN